MSLRVALVTLAAFTLMLNLAMAQDFSMPAEDTSAVNASEPLNFPSESLDVGNLSQTSSASVTLFKTEAQQPGASIVGQSTAQQELVSNTLTIVGGAALIGLVIVVVGILLYSSQRNMFGEQRNDNSNW